MKKCLSLVLAVCMILTIFASVPASAETLTSGDYEYHVYSIGDKTYAYIDKYNGSLPIVSIPSAIGGYDVRMIGNGAFMENDIITTVIIPDAVRTIAGRAFMSCSDLRYVTLPEGLTNIDFNAFNGCTSLKSIDLPRSLVSVGDMAFCSTSITSVIIHRDIHVIGNWAFGYHKNEVGAIAKVDGFTIQGFRKTQAEVYAKKYDITFIATIENVGITVPAVNGGDHPDYTVTKDTDECALLSGDGAMAKLFAPHGTGLEYINKQTGARLNPEDTFEAGKTYVATIYLTANSSNGYLFGIGDEAPAITINGEEADIFPTSTFTYAQREFVALGPGGSYWIGDVNSDGSVKNRDALILDRYIAGWKDYDKQIKNKDAADLNRDGQIKNRDVLMLDRYIAGWKDYQKYVFQVNG